MTSYDAYKLYLAIKLHFTTANYDYFKHNAKVNSSLNAFLKRNDRFFFHKLATKYGDELMYYYVSNFVDRPKTWVGDLVRADGDTIYNKWKKYNESFSYNFRNDCVLVRNVIDGNNIRFDDVFSVDSGQHPRLLRLLLSGKVSIQSVIIFDKILSFISRWDKEIKETIIWPEKSFKITKLRPFINVNITKCKFIMKEIFV
tara:strand:- start:35 stop:634 length:600 start_codon:yes stop_codon:yes gene_type:complete